MGVIRCLGTDRNQKGQARMRRIIPGLLMLLWAAAAPAATSLQFGPPPQWVRPRPIPAPGAATSTAIKVLLLDHQVELSPWTVSHYFESAVRIQTPQGLSMMGTVKVAWNPDTDVVVIHKIHILRGNKVIDVLGSGQTFTIARREVNLDYAAIDGTLTAILEPTDLEVGDILDVAYTLQRTDPILAGTSEGEVAIPPAAPVVVAHVRALWPTSDPVKWQATQGLTGIHPIHSGRMSGIEATMSNLQPIVQPKGAPLRFLVDRRIDFSSFGSWAEVARRLAPLYTAAARLSAGSPLQAQIARIRAASPDPKVQAAMALALVENEVRYVFLGMNEGGLVPASADLTWSRRYGDCKAKTVLLMALLGGLGIDAQPVAVNIFRGDGLDARLPMIQLFDHVLVRSVIDGKTYWLDGTRMGDTRLDRLREPFYHWGLPLVPSGAELAQMLPPPLTEPVIDESIVIDASGGVAQPAPVHAQTEIHGAAGVMLRSRLDNLTPTQLDTTLRTVWSRQRLGVKVLSVAATYDAQSGAERLTMDGTVTMNWAGGWHELANFGLGYKADFNREPGPNHDAPYAVPYPSFISTTETIKLPREGNGFSVVGADVDSVLAGVQFRRHVSIAGGVVTATASVCSVMPEFPASEASADQASLLKLAGTDVKIEAPAGHVPTEAEIAWGLPSYNGTATDYLHSGYLLSQHREFDAAIADYDAALALDSRNASALGYRGLAYLQMGHAGHARIDFDTALAIDPHAWLALDGQGMLALRAGDDSSAITAFSAAISSDPKEDGFVLPMRAQAYWRAGERAQALADYSAAIQQKPAAIGFYWYRAVLLGQEGKKAEAIRQAQLVTAANPKLPLAYFTAGAIYMSVDERSEAGAAFDRALAVAPPVARTYLMRAGYRPWTDLSGRRADIESALKLDSKSAPALAMLAQVQMAAGQYADAAASLTTAIGKTPGGPDMLTLRGIAYEKAGQAALARADFAKALTQAKQPGALNNVCWELATADVSLTSALDDCNAALAKEPALVAALDSRGFVLMRLRRYDQAIASYTSALKLDPLQADSLYGRGICELRAGKKSRGRADIKAATALSYAVADEFAHYGVRP
jgi:tetratricopeptide (TPR) repeat protein/transglutaminase-like putative cysteine protease